MAAPEPSIECESSCSIRDYQQKCATEPSFGEFAVSHLITYHLGDGIDREVLRAAAEAHVFRFDASIPAQAIRERLKLASDAVATHTGRSANSARRRLTHALRSAERAYFDIRWADVSAVVTANAADIVRLRGKDAQTDAFDEGGQDADGESDPRVAHIAPHVANALMGAGHSVMVEVFTNYCSKCAALAPLFRAAAHDTPHIRFVAIDAVLHPDARTLFNVSAFPTVLLLRQGRPILVFPPAIEPTAARLAAFACGADPLAVDVHAPVRTLPPDVVRSADAATAALGQWAIMLRRQGIDELEALVEERSALVHMRIDEAMRCGTSACDVLPGRSPGALPPMCILLGGGMGAGKTTAVSAIARTPFWEEHGTNVVCVEADAFKEQDPFFHVLRALTPSAARVVHADSTAAAETLFLEAVNRRRDVVFDGTLSWSEYARQTVAMLRDGAYEYARGPGYVVLQDGSIKEEYWVRARKRVRAAPPYRVELVAVTVDAAAAVARGIVRHIISGRGVNVADQLRSHALFSSHFEEYVRLVDSTYLFDMTDDDHNDNECDDEAELWNDDVAITSKIIAMQAGVLFGDENMKAWVHKAPTKRSFMVKNGTAYKRFLRKQSININAKCVEDLFPVDGEHV